MASFPASGFTAIRHGLFASVHRGISLAEVSAADDGPYDCSVHSGVGGQTAMGYRIGGLFGILLTSLIGFALPNIFRGPQYNFMFFIFQAFAAGVIVAVGIVHIFPEAAKVLENPCLGFSDFPWGPMITLFAILLTFIFEHSLELLMLGRSSAHGIVPMDTKEEGVEGLASSNEKGDSNKENGALEEDVEPSAMQHYRVVAYCLEVGMIFHSMFVGISLGTSQDIKYVQGLTFALLFHQGFEGVALGGALARARLGRLKLLLCCVAFVLTAPLGIAIGIAVTGSYNENDITYLAFEGIINSISAGILVYNGIVDLILPAFATNEEKPRSKICTCFGFVGLLGGAGAMTLIAIWA